MACAEVGVADGRAALLPEGAKLPGGFAACWIVGFPLWTDGYILEERYKKEEVDEVQYPSKQQQQQQQQHFTFLLYSFILITAGQAGTASALPDPLIHILTLHTPSALPCSWRPKIATIRLGAFGEKARLWRRVAERS
ncbi:hypothetical protein BO85DRAFT_438209 [Aspergillus piperis CBS 112811]|uniref:Uncharacterized protein n=1 Tax=Aspergillus piperis CBS 112811 TaxID=1448313 RepID=A0A8G1VPR3_9EURO|nr:hypothetical protein BO85DRAFT_438209 [Aspergillus piperis CBS 112811]RAH57983.1 hypothetical protein BO85DRAFT_438209 [Aspergillus piperis CBS 112811]